MWTKTAVKGTSNSSFDIYLHQLTQGI